MFLQDILILIFSGYNSLAMLLEFSSYISCFLDNGRQMSWLEEPIDHTCAIICIRPLITDTQTNTLQTGNDSCYYYLFQDVEVAHHGILSMRDNDFHSFSVRDFSYASNKNIVIVASIFFTNMNAIQGWGMIL